MSDQNGAQVMTEKIEEKLMSEKMAGPPWVYHDAEGRRVTDWNPVPVDPQAAEIARLTAALAEAEAACSRWSSDYDERGRTLLAERQVRKDAEEQITALRAKNARLRKALTEARPYVDHHRGGDPKTTLTLARIAAALGSFIYYRPPR